MPVWDRESMTFVANSRPRRTARVLLHDRPLRYGLEIAPAFSLKEVPSGTHGLRLSGLNFMLRPDDVFDGRLHPLRPANGARFGFPQR